MSPRIFAYAYPTKSDPTCQKQIGSFLSAGVEKQHIYVDALNQETLETGTTRRRFDEVIKRVQVGDTLKVATLGHLVRNRMELYDTIQFLRVAGVRLVTLVDPIVDTAGAGNDQISSFAQAMRKAENGLWRERPTDALTTWKAAHKPPGKPRRVLGEDARLDWKTNETLTAAQVAEKYDTSVTKLNRDFGPRGL